VPLQIRSDCLENQAFFKMALQIISNLRITATTATFFAFPEANNL
jgi:hypothetical protein